MKQNRNKSKLPARPPVEMVSRQTIVEKIAAVEQEREEFRQEANRQLAAYNGAITILKGLLGEEEPSPPAPSTGSGQAPLPIPGEGGGEGGEGGN